MGTIKGYIQDVRVPISFVLQKDCVNEIVYVDAFILGIGKVATINAIIPGPGDPNPSGLVKGDKKGVTITVLLNFSLVGSSGSNFTLVARTQETGVVFTSPLIVISEDGYTVEGYQGNVIDPEAGIVIRTDGPATEFLAADGKYYEINVPPSNPDDRWDDETYYNTDDPVLYEYNNITSWYASKVENNLNNPPRILSGANEGEVNTDFWTLITAESSQPLVKYVPNTLFKQEFVIVVKDKKFYELLNQTRPYFSVDFDVELNTGDWEIRGGGDQYLLPYEGTIETVEPSWSDFAGITVNTINGHQNGPIGWLFSKLIKEVLASKASNKSVVLSGVNSQTVEVGTTLSPLLTANFNQGSIRNGGGSIAGPLVGPATSYEFRDPSGAVIAHTPDDPVDNSQQAQAPAYELATRGSFTWSVTVQHAAGSTDYFDNIDTESPDNNLAAEEAAGSASDSSSTVNTRFYCWDHHGDQGTSPTDSVGVRALVSKRFLGGSDTGSFTDVIPAGAEEYSFYCIAGKTKTIIDNSNLNLPLSYTTTAMTVNDTSGTAQSYERVTVFLGLGGRASSTNITVTIS